MSDVEELFAMATRHIEPGIDVWLEQEERQRRRVAGRRVQVFALVAALITAAVVLVQVLGDAGRAPQVVPAGSPTPVVIDTPGEPSGIAEADGSIWVSTYSGTLYRIDPATNRVEYFATGQPSSCGDLAVEAGSIWVSGCAHWGGSTSVAIAPSTGAVVGSSRLESLVFGDGKAWGFNGGAGPEVREIDAATGRVIDTLDRHYAFALGYAFHSLWLYGNGVVAQLDPDTGSVLQYYSLPAGADAFPIHGKGGGFVSAGGYVWLTAYDGDVYEPDVSSGAVYRLDPSTGQVVRALSIALDPTMSTETLGPEAFLDAHDGTVWVAKSPDTVVGIDAHTGRVVESYPAGGHGAVDVLATDDSLWVVNSTGTVWRYAR